MFFLQEEKDVSLKIKQSWILLSLIELPSSLHRQPEEDDVVVKKKVSYKYCWGPSSVVLTHIASFLASPELGERKCTSEID